MPEVRLGGGINFCSCIISPAGAASLRTDSGEHSAFSLPKVVERISGEASGVANRREDCRTGSGVTYDSVAVFIGGYAGHPAPQTLPTLIPALLWHRCGGGKAARKILL